MFWITDFSGSPPLLRINAMIGKWYLIGRFSDDNT